MGIQKPISRLDSRHPSFKPDLTEAGKNQQLKVKSAVVSKGSQKPGGSCSTTSGSQEQPVGQGGRTSNKTSSLTDPEKLELKEKPYRWIPAQMDRLDLKGYVKEIYSFKHFNRNSKTFMLETIAIADWGCKCYHVSLPFPIPGSLTTCSMSLLGPDRDVGKSPLNPTI